MNAGTITQDWNAELYDEKHSFVFKYGENLVDTLDPQPGEKILDLGCGTGYLAEAIALTGAQVVGIDNSPEMIVKAKAAYPKLEFKVQSADDFYFDEPFDAIFSNAALHWVLNKEAAIDCMYRNLRRSGRLVLEMGGRGNVQDIIGALQDALVSHGYGDNMRLSPWYFPSIAEYTTLLEKRGFRVVYATLYNRETELKDTENGIIDWIKMLGSSFLVGIEETKVEAILNEAQDSLRETNFRRGKWFADYKRLRITAIKDHRKTATSN